MTQPPPTPTLFPYTTLFRSRKLLVERIAGVGTLAEGLAHEVKNPLNGALLQLALLRRRLGQPDCDPASLEPRRDRKSTRLNSSHANSSYAVFCLKKKRDHVR